jgi:uncharacterized surface protein with fasciclin (FAS1) repeats
MLAFTAVVMLFASCSTEDNAGNTPAPNPNIAQIIAQDPSFSFLNAAVNKAGLASALTANDITVFAPDNGAFQRSGINDLNAVNNLSVAQLREILTYHVISRRRPIATLPSSDTTRTANLQNVYLSNTTMGRYVNGIGFTQTDRQGSNGYIHVVDKVLMPPNANKSIANVVANDTTFSFLLRAVIRLNLVSFFDSPNKLTVFAPNNQAFRNAGITNVDAVPLATLDAVLRSHVLPSNVFRSDLLNNGNYFTILPGRSVTVQANIGAANVKIIGSPSPPSFITTPDIICTNGVIHVINRTMLP